MTEIVIILLAVAALIVILLLLYWNTAGNIRRNLRPLAISVGSIGLQRHRAGRFDDLETLAPAYLRPPDIRPNPIPLLSQTEQDH